MVEVIYTGRLGNRLFQYCFGRIVAEHLGWQLRADSIKGFPATQCRITGVQFSEPVLKLQGDAVVDFSAFLEDTGPCRLVVRAWMQRFEYYRPYVTRIRQWLEPEPPVAGSFPVAGPNDLLLNFRLGADYLERNWILHPAFYAQVLELENHVGKIYVCYDSAEPKSRQLLDGYLRAIGSLRPYLFVQPIRWSIFISFGNSEESPCVQALFPGGRRFSQMLIGSISRTFEDQVHPAGAIPEQYGKLDWRLTSHDT